MSDSRKTESPAERAERNEIEKSLKVSTYIGNDAFWESIHTGIKPQVNVPNYGNPKQGGTYASESDGVHMDMNNLYKSASDNMNPDELHNAMQDSHVPREGDESTFGHPLPSVPPPSMPQLNPNRFTLSKNQALAIKKYPALVEFLGRSEGEKIAKQINGEMNLVMADVVHKNSQEANDYAVMCKADKQNLREYFVGEGWACRVTASGPFTGDEVIYYSKEKDVACVLRRAESKGEVTYSDISTKFNIIYEAEEGDIHPENIIEKSAETVVAVVEEVQEETQTEDVANSE